MSYINPNIQIAKNGKVRVLCLYGYQQNANLFKKKLGSLLKYMKKYVEFVFLDAPHTVKEYEGNTQNKFSWWFNKDNCSFEGNSKIGPAYGFEKSLKIVETVWQSQGPFHGIFGFSQGACFEGLICGLSKRRLTLINPDFVVISSGFISGSLIHKIIYEELITLPALHIYGLADEIIPKVMSEKLSKHFKNIEIVEHEGGHYFPVSMQQKGIYINFFRCRLQHLLQ